jgi:uncharacterized oxidoreductase
MIIAGRRAALGGVAKGSPGIATATVDVTDPQHIARFSSEIARSQPKEDHLLPLYVVLGASPRSSGVAWQH